jgi:hypothetical protein
MILFFSAYACSIAQNKLGSGYYFIYGFPKKPSIGVLAAGVPCRVISPLQ